MVGRERLFVCAAPRHSLGVFSSAFVLYEPVDSSLPTLNSKLVMGRARPRVVLGAPTVR